MSEKKEKCPSQQFKHSLCWPWSRTVFRAEVKWSTVASCRLAAWLVDLSTFCLTDGWPALAELSAGCL